MRRCAAHPGATPEENYLFSRGVLRAARWAALDRRCPANPQDSTGSSVQVSLVARRKDAEKVHGRPLLCLHPPRRELTRLRVGYPCRTATIGHIAYRRWKRGLRFSKNAVTPSRMSGVAKIVRLTSRDTNISAAIRSLFT